MGCVFSRNEALSFRKKKKNVKIDKIHHGHERLSTLPSLHSVHPVKKPVESRPTPSKGAQSNISFIYEGILQEYSTLGFLMGGRNFPDGELVFRERQERKPALQDSTKVPPPQIDIPVSLPAAVSSHEAVREVAAKTIRTTVNLPDCLRYQGLHDNGYHLIWLESATYCRSLESTAHISEAISSVVGGSLFKVVYRQHHGNTAYLPHQLAHAGELFDTLCTRFGPQLLLIIFYNPSWYVRTCLEEQRHTGRLQLFSFPTMDRIRFIQKPDELAKWTGFPGDVKLPLN